MAIEWVLLQFRGEPAGERDNFGAAYEAKGTAHQELSNFRRS